MLLSRCSDSLSMGGLPPNAPITSAPPFCFSPEQLRVLSFNGRGIIVQNDGDRHRYIQYLQLLISQQRPDAVCLQEVHGLEADVELSLSRAFPGWTILASHCIDSDGLPYSAAGGAAILISPRLARLAAAQKLVFFPGRCMVALLQLGDRVMRIINIHNSTLTILGVRKIVEFLEFSRNRDCATPMESASPLIGDMNFLALGERRFKAGRPVAASLRVAAATSSTFQNIWMRELKFWTEISQPFPTNFSASGDSCARIDRAFSTIPTSHLINMKVSSAVVGTPEDNEARCISDHAAFDVTFGLHQKQVSSANAIPRHICKHPIFADKVQIYADDLDLLATPATTQLPLLKIIFTEAARAVRDHLLTHDSQGIESQRLVVASVARAVWRQDHRLASRLLRSSPLAPSLVGLSGNFVFLD